MNMTQEYIPTPLPVDQDLETKKVLKKIVSANRALAELKGAARSATLFFCLCKFFSIEPLADYQKQPTI